MAERQVGSTTGCLAEPDSHYAEFFIKFLYRHSSSCQHPEVQRTSIRPVTNTQKRNGLHLSRRHGDLCRPRRRPCQGLRVAGGRPAMSWLTLAAAIAAAGLFIY